MRRDPFTVPSVRRLRIFTRDDGSFDPTWPDDGAGVIADSIPVLDAGGNEIDVVAWEPKQPGRWWRHTGDGVVLGQWPMNWAHMQKAPINLHPTPAAWLKAVEARDQFAVCLLDWDKPIKLSLGLAARIECASAALAERLRRAILAQSLPRFSIGVRAHV